MKHHPELADAAWAPEDADRMLRGLAAAAGLAMPRLTAVSRPGPGVTPVMDAARAAGLRAEPVTVWARNAWAAVRRVAPVVLEIPGRPGRLAVARAGASHAWLSTPGGHRRVPAAALEDALWAPVEAGADFQNLATGTISSGAGRDNLAAARVLVLPALEGRPLGEGWLLRSMTTRVRDELRAAKVGRRAAAVLGAYFLQFALLLAIWGEVGRQTLGGAAEGPGRFVALLAAWVLAQLGASWLLSRLALDVGGTVRSALMRGALRLDRDRIRTAGLGQLLGRAMDAEVLDVLALGGGVELVAAAFELTLGALALGAGAAPAASLAALALILVVLLATARVQVRRSAAWSDRRRALTHDLVERMVGHRTVLVQDRPDERAQADEAALDGYRRDTRALDHWEAILSVAIPRLWLMGGLAVLAPVLWRAAGLASAPQSLGGTALSVGGVWLAYGALRRLGSALPTLALAREAWREIAPLVGGAHKNEDAAPAGPDSAGAPHGGDGAAPVLLAAVGAGYRYPGRPAPALSAVDLTIAAGERVLVEGASGGGKSTLGSLLTGLRVPTEGYLRLHGVEQARVGLDRWRRTVAGAPQFHDNHVFSADLLFNVLMGRRWPPRLEDVEEAERVCRAVGLGPLLERMPAGLQQQVGETGWRLSHGERSRLFIARSLLQPVEARVLDESFAALDPETLDAVLAAVLARPQALIVVAHP
jgi:ATP-binding cassette, subfamily B, bacterial